MTKLLWTRHQNRKRFHKGEPLPTDAEVDRWIKNKITNAQRPQLTGPATQKQIEHAKKLCRRKGYGYPSWLEGSKQRMSDFIDELTAKPDAES